MHTSKGVGDIDRRAIILSEKDADDSFLCSLCGSIVMVYGRQKYERMDDDLCRCQRQSLCCCCRRHCIVQRPASLLTLVNIGARCSLEKRIARLGPVAVRTFCTRSDRLTTQLAI